MKANRRWVIAAFGASALAPFTPAFAQESTRADRAFEALAARWLDRSMRFSPVSATGIGDHRFDDRVDDVSPAGRAASLRFYARNPCRA
ncbi:MAG: DUF885 domain-containing protein [Terricaulis sp.]|nr:DUF885 domain-containing protein [Terricaulis sp.]